MLMMSITGAMVLGLIMMSFMVLGQVGEALSLEITEKTDEAPMMLLTTGDGSTNVEVVIENATVLGNSFTIDQPQVVTLNLAFLDPLTDLPIQHINYNFVVTDQNGNIVHKIHKSHTHDGINSYSLLFPDTGSFTLTIAVEGVGGPPPYDTTFSGTATSSLAVTPEFPLSVMWIMAAVVGIAVMASRFRDLGRP
jgi:hypothetical protein